jgi:kynureninase
MATGAQCGQHSSESGRSLSDDNIKAKPEAIAKVAVPTDADFARDLDAQDALAPFKERFVLGDPELIYLDGNSLGRLPKMAVARMAEAVKTEWGRRLIRGWNEGWYDLPERVGGKLAKLMGAGTDEIIMADATSVNLFKLATAAVRAQSGRTKIVSDSLNFPSDLYILQGVVEMAGPDYVLEVVPSADGLHGPVEELAKAVDEKTALVALSHTVFKSGYTYDMQAVTELAHRKGALMLWDTSHSAGAMPIDLGTAGVDLAVGCSYKYLNGGPGAPAFLYIRRDLQEQLNNPISGWMGQNQPFEFSLKYEPIAGLRRFLTGTPPVLALSAVEPGLDILLEAGLDRVRAKSIQQTDYLIDLWEVLLAPLGFRLNSPRRAAKRGSHVTLGHVDGWRISQSLIHDMQVLPDFRGPDNIRFGVAPLYTSYTDLHEAVMRLRRLVVGRYHENYPLESATVT